MNVYNIFNTESMKKLTIYSLLLAMLFVACDPIENRESIGGAITADQLNISATPVVVNGKNSNKIILENNSPVLSLWDYGMGVSNRAQLEVLLVLTGENKIVFTGLNADGSKITKELTVNVEELSFEVANEWALLCGDGSKEWIWDDTQPSGADGPEVFGNGGYLGNTAPGWWKVGIANLDEQAKHEGAGATMLFSTSGAALTKTKSDGTSIKGGFSFDMDKQVKDDAGNVWSKGKLYTKNVTILCGISPDEGGVPAYEFDILNLDEEKMALAYAVPGTGAWGTAHFWMFRAK